MPAVTLLRRSVVCVAALAFAACHGQTAAVAPAPLAPEQTLAEFLAAVNANDLNRMALLWGTQRGPSTISNHSKPEVQHQRLVIMQHALVTDSFHIEADDPVPGRAHARRIQVTLMRNNRRVLVPFTLVVARTGGWLIQDFGLDAALPLATPH